MGYPGFEGLERAATASPAVQSHEHQAGWQDRHHDDGIGYPKVGLGLRSPPERGRLGLRLALLLLLTKAAVAAPGQADVGLAAGAVSITLDYRIQVPGGRARALHLTLPAQTIQQARQRFKAYDPSELQREADAETLRQIEAALDRLRGRYTHATFAVQPDRRIRWTIGSPADFAGHQQSIYDQHLARAIAKLGTDFPAARIASEDGRIAIQAPDQAQLRRIEQRLLAAQESANRAVADYAQQVTNEVELDAQEIHAHIEADLETIQEGIPGFTRKFLRDRLYTLSGENTLHPDYARIAQLALDDLAPVAPSLRLWTQGMDRREALEHLLSVIQSIPYDGLEDRATDAGFLVPPLVLAENRGDCDSKAVTFAALARLLYPDLPIALLLLPRHAYLALGIAPDAQDEILRHDGRLWTLAEAAGPGLSPLGRLAAESQGQEIESLVLLFP